MNDVEVSILLPVYNAGQYLKPAVDSVLNQSFKEFELFLIDDGSSDGSSELCDQYALKDKRVQVIHQKNEGICCARNNAIKQAKGKYIAFCDHDDLFLPGMLEKLVFIAEKNDCDIVKCCCEERYIESDKVYYRRIIGPEKDIVYKKEKLGDAFLFKYTNGYMGYIWDGIYKKEAFIKSGFFNPKMKFGYEDEEIQFRLFRSINSIAFVKDVFYVHNIRRTFSTSQKYDNNKIESMLWTVEEAIKSVQYLKLDNKHIEYPAWFVARGLSNVVIEFSMPNCTLKRKEKKEKYKLIRSEKSLEPYFKFNYLYKVIKQNKKWGIVMLCFYFRAYKLLQLVEIIKKISDKKIKG